MNVSYADIMACSNGKKGVELQLKAEQKTHTVAKPYPSFIPTIVYDEVRIFNFLHISTVGSVHLLPQVLLPTVLTSFSM